MEEIGAYAVFWAQSLWKRPGEPHRAGQRADVVQHDARLPDVLARPKVWQNPAPLSRIDTTAIKVGDHYYRVTKNEAGNAGSDIFSEKHTDFLDSNINNWTLVAPASAGTTWLANQGYEGPVIFKANPGDTACPGQFYLWGDRYTNGGGYQRVQREHRGPDLEREDDHDDQRGCRASTARSCRSRCASGTASAASRTATSPPPPSSSLPPATILQGDTPTITATVRGGGLVRDRWSGSIHRGLSGRSPTWTTAWPRSPCRAPSRVGVIHGHGGVPRSRLPGPASRGQPARSS